MTATRPESRWHPTADAILKQFAKIRALTVPEVLKYETFVAIPALGSRMLVRISNDMRPNAGALPRGL